MRTIASRLAYFAYALLLVASLLTGLLHPAIAHADSAQSSTYTAPGEFGTGTFSGVTTTGTGVDASLALCAGGMHCEQYQRDVSIDNYGGPDVYAAEVKIPLDTASLIAASKMQSDCGDLRIMAADGTTEITNARVIDCNSPDTIIDLLVPHLAADASTHIFIYYGSLNHLSPLNGSVRSNLDTSMATDPTSVASLMGDASWDSTNHYVQLTSNYGGQNGALQYNNNPGDNFDFSTQFWSGGGDGADAIYLYMGADEYAPNEFANVGGYVFAYDEYHDYIGLQHQGQGLKAVFCPGYSHDAGELPFNAEDMTDDSHACNLDNSTWRTARVVRSGNHIQMYLDGDLVIDYQPETLPAAAGQYMGWGARTGGSTNYHRIRNLTLDITASSVVEGEPISIGDETGTGELANDGTWTTPVYTMVTKPNFRGAWGDGDDSTVALSGHYSNIASGDRIDVGVKLGQTLSDTVAAPANGLGSYGDVDGGSFSLTVGDLKGYVSLDDNKYVQFVFTLHREGETSPQLDDMTFNYSPDFYGPPSAPQNIRVVSSDGRNIEFAWDPPAQDNNSPVTTYAVAYKFAGGSWDNVLGSDSFPSTNTSTTFTLPKLGRAYDIGVQAWNTYGWSEEGEMAYTTGDPATYHISDCEHLQAINDAPESWSDNFVLDNNIDCTDTVNWNEGAGFIPIAFNSESSFNGSLDGQGHTISGLYIDLPDSYNVGLFASTSFASMANITFNNATIRGAGYAGALVGSAGDETVFSHIGTAGNGIEVTGASEVGGLIGYLDANNSDASLTDIDLAVDASSSNNSCDLGGVVGEMYVYYGLTVNRVSTRGSLAGNCGMGGFAGYMEGTAQMSNATSSMNISALEGYTGGLIGEFVQDSDVPPALTNLSASGDITSVNPYAIGGLIGYIEGGGDNSVEVSKVYATGNITQTGEASYGYDVGGLIGQAYGITITNAYATGRIDAPIWSSMGGLVGYTDKAVSISNSYASGSVNGSDRVGGLLGEANGPISNSFATGHVTADGQYAAGLVGYGYICAANENCAATFTLANVYYDQASSGQADCYNAFTWSDDIEDYEQVYPDGCHASNDKTRYYNKANQPLATWDFAHVWQAHANTYPTFTAGEDSLPGNGGSSGGTKVVKKPTTTGTTTDSVQPGTSQDTASPEGKTSVIMLNDFLDYFGHGKQLNVKPGQVIYFNHKAERHSVTIKEIGDGYVVVVIASDPITDRLTVGQTKQYDVDRDGVNDVEIHVNGITNGLADMSFRQLADPSSPTKEAPAQNWWWLLVVVITALVIWVVVRRRKKQDSENR